MKTIYDDPENVLEWVKKIVYLYLWQKCVRARQMRAKDVESEAEKVIDHIISNPDGHFILWYANPVDLLYEERKDIKDLVIKHLSEYLSEYTAAI